MENRVKEGYYYRFYWNFIVDQFGTYDLFVLMGLWSFTVALLTDNSVKTEDDETDTQNKTQTIMQAQMS